LSGRLDARGKPAAQPPEPTFAETVATGHVTEAKPISTRRLAGTALRVAAWPALMFVLAGDVDWFILLICLPTAG
jgi:hypothetical protein